MRRWIGLAMLIFVGTAGWRIGEVLSPDALSMATGVLFGVMAGVPTALLVMAGSRRREERAEESRPRPQHSMPMHLQGQPHNQMHPWAAPYAQQPPIIVLAGPQAMHHAQQPVPAPAGWFPQEPPARHFTVVGDQEALLEEW